MCTVVNQGSGKLRDSIWELDAGLPVRSQTSIPYHIFGDGSLLALSQVDSPSIREMAS